MMDNHRGELLVRWVTIFLAALLLSVPQLNTRAEVLPAPKILQQLCGQLVFLTEKKTGQQTIGLLPCGQNTPYIFYQHPRELYNYYQFKNAKIDNGPVFLDIKYEKLSKYIMGWEGYEPLTNCSACGKDISVSPTPLTLPTITQMPTLTDIPTFTPSPVPTALPTLEFTDTPPLVETIPEASLTLVSPLITQESTLTPSSTPPDSILPLPKVTCSPGAAGALLLSVVGLLLNWRRIKRR